MTIANVESHEALWEKMGGFPGSPYLKFEFDPLSDHNYFYDNVIERPQNTASG